MFLRGNRIFRLLTLCLFVFELAVPVFASGTTARPLAEAKVQLSSLYYQSLFSPLLLEELSENEEEEDGTKNIFLENYSDPIGIPKNSFVRHVEKASYVNHFQKFGNNPRLFQIYCNLLI